MPSRLIRRFLRRTAQAAHYGWPALDQSPTLFANSFPKSGTHLLTQIMKGFTAIGPAVDSGLPAIVTFRGDTGQKRAEAEIIADLERLLPGDIAYGHVHASPGVIQVLNRQKMAVFFILRDPRDVVISHVHYITKMESRHVHHQLFSQGLPDFDARLCASISGLSSTDLAAAGDKSNQELPNIRARFEPFMGWLDQAPVLLLRFEDLITQRQKLLRSILRHAEAYGFQPVLSMEKALQILENSIDPQKSPTFRSGKIGGWKSAFTPKHKELFKQVSGDLLQRLGYETEYDW